jgi:cobalt-zinc-cadmium resistance protein CzcA
MTLGGVAIAVGLLLDASIIMVENHPRLSLRMRFAASARSRRGRGGPSHRFRTLIVMAVFLPLFGMSGIEGRMYRPLAAAVVATVGASLILAITLVPIAPSCCGREPPGSQRTSASSAALRPFMRRCSTSA